MRERAEYAAALLLQLVGGGMALLVASRSWQQVRVARPAPFQAVTVVELPGRTVDALPTALALVALAGVIAVLATRGVARRAVGCLVALAGAGLIWRGVAGEARMTIARATRLAQSRHPGLSGGRVTVHVITVWPALTVACGVLVLLAGLLAGIRGQAWSVMSARYERAADPVRSAEDIERERFRANASLWSALDRGDDPTASPVAADGPSGHPAEPEDPLSG